MEEVMGTGLQNLGIRYSEYGENTVEGVEEDRGWVRTEQLPAIPLLLLVCNLSERVYLEGYRKLFTVKTLEKYEYKFISLND
jgi:hypothetical protein